MVYRVRGFGRLCRFGEELLRRRFLAVERVSGSCGGSVDLGLGVAAGIILFVMCFYFIFFWD